MHMRISKLYLALCFLTGLVMNSNVAAQKKVNSIQELGTVTWLRDYETALGKSKETNKPVLILFQEVPGCLTCRSYGDNILSHPLIVDAIENEFVPLAIYNNKGGADKKILERYGEPTWNNPVVRIVDSTGENIIKRLAGNYTAEGLVLHMSLALRTVGKGEPEYLSLLKEELTASNKETAYYKMYCFWSGESHLGSKAGVIETEPGWMGGHEVVKVIFDKDRISKKELDNYAEKSSCSPLTKEANYRIDKDPQYYLKKSSYRFLPLSEIQKSKINAALAKREDAEIFLSPIQLAWLKSSELDKVLYTKDFLSAWEKAMDHY